MLKDFFSQEECYQLLEDSLHYGNFGLIMFNQDGELLYMNPWVFDYLDLSHAFSSPTTLKNQNILKIFTVFYPDSVIQGNENLNLEKSQGMFELITIKGNAKKGSYVFRIHKETKNQNAICNLLLTEEHYPTQEKKTFANINEFNHSLLNAAPVFFVAMNQRMQILQMNDYMLKSLGYTDKEVLGENYLDKLIPWHDKEKVQSVLQHLFTSTVFMNAENDIQSKTGEIFSVQWQGRRVLDENGETSFVFGIGLDITTHKKAQQFLKESEENFKALCGRANDGILIAIEEGRFVYANRKASTILGYSIEELTTFAFPQIMDPDYLSLILDRYHSRMAGKPTPNLYEVIMTHRDGHPIFVEVSGSITYWKGEKADIVIFRDITKRKKIEEELRSSEQKYRNLVENAEEGICILDVEGKLTFINKKALEILKYEEEELLGQPPEKILDPANQIIFANQMQMRKEHKKSRYEITFKNKYGKSIDTIVAATPLLDKEGKSIGSMAIITDITQRKAEQRKLAESEANYRSIFNSVNDAIIVLDMDTLQLLDLNDKMSQMLGYTKMEALELSLKDFTKNWEESKEEVFKLIKLAHKQQNTLFEWVFLHKTRYSLWGEVNLKIETIHGKKRLLAVVRDITQRKKIEKELLDYKNHLEHLVEQRTQNLQEINQQLKKENTERKVAELQLQEANRMLMAKVKELHCLYNIAKLFEEKTSTLNTILEKASNLLPSAFIEEKWVHIRIIYEKQSFTSQNFKETSKKIEGNIVFEDEILGVLEIYYDNQNTPPRDDIFQNKDDFLLSSLTNRIAQIITLKRSSVQLMESQERYQYLFNRGYDVVFMFHLLEHNIPGNFIEINDIAVKKWGYSREELMSLSPNDLFFQDEELDFQEIIKELPNRKHYIYEVKVISKYKDTFELEINSHLFNLQGKPTILSIARDITQRKQYERKLRETYHQLQNSYNKMIAIYNQLNLGTCIIDENGMVIFISQKGQELLGIQMGEAGAKYWEEIFPFSKEVRNEIKVQLNLSLEQRKKISAAMINFNGKSLSMDIDIKDDPDDPKSKILFLYDTSEIQDLRRILEDKADFHNIIGRSEPMKKVFSKIQEIAKVDWTVLIEGETGTGKELVAKAIHSASERGDKTFVGINCAELTDSLLSSQLFGHKKGSFTGALSDHIGFFEAANGGTIFLDEIGDISKSMQNKLLRVLEEREIMRIGETKSRKINVRIIAATNKNLATLVEKGKFRKDLLYRIRVNRIQLPPLKERREDIPLLIKFFLGECRITTGKNVYNINDKALRMLMQYHWPGNVRELRSAIEFAIINAKTHTIEQEDLPPEINQTSPVSKKTKAIPSDKKHSDIKLLQKELILEELKKSGGNISKSAKELGISRTTLYNRLRELGIEY